MIDLRPAKELLDIHYKQQHHENALYFGANESIEHAKAKLEKCYELNKEGKRFYTEAVFRGRISRADIYCLDEMVAYEIVESETEKSISDKRTRYPCPIEVIKASGVVCIGKLNGKR